MILTCTTYGVCVTDEFGYPMDGMSDLLAAVHASVNSLYDTLPWLATCPSAEKPQVVVGIQTTVNRSTDFAQLHQHWETAVAQAPEAVQTLLQGREPDVWFLAGHA